MQRSYFLPVFALASASIAGHVAAAAPLPPFQPQVQIGPLGPVRDAHRPTRGPESPPEAPPAAWSAGEHPWPKGTDEQVDVLLHSGELVCRAVDLRIPGRGLDLVWARKYRSQIGPDTALGHGWDFSYDLRVEGGGSAVTVHDGNTRADRYLLRPNGKYAAVELFREGEFNPDTTFTLTFADGLRWNFRPLSASPAPGRIASVIDRNGNALLFAYDAQGRLATITDTLSRACTLSYDASNRIVRFQDFGGRRIDYAYYGPSDTGGADGDLKSVTTQAVTGTPNGNDYPFGKTTLYTYSRGFADSRLNHNLLTITDATGQTWLVNTYSTDASPQQRDFDRLLAQQKGSPGENLHFVYIPTGFAQPGDPDPVRERTIVNDRNRNVREYFYDGRNRLVLKREFTGRAPLDAPTTATANRPVNKLRPGDPDSFDTGLEYNADARVTRLVRPEGNETRNVHELELDPGAAWRTRGNLREIHRLAGSHLPVGDQAQIDEFFEYDPGFGGCCGADFVSRHVDGRGAVTLHQYDAFGNRTHTTHRIPAIVEDWEYDSFGRRTAHVWPANGAGGVGVRRRDEYQYYGPVDGAQNGYLKAMVVDANGLALTSMYAYDSFANVKSVKRPATPAWTFDVNQRNQIVRATTPEVTAGSGITYSRDLFYDANDRLMRVDLENKDENGAPPSNDHFTTLYEYDALDRLVRTRREVDIGHDAVVEYGYDANRNRSLVRYGEAFNGNQPENTLALLYDERDLLFREVRATGSPDQSSVQYDWDRNARPKTLRQGLEAAPRLTTYTYDAMDRRIRTVDPMGDETEVHYDANSNIASEIVRGELDDVPGSAGNVRLAETTYQYDAMDRRIHTDVAHFNTQTQLPIGDGFSTTTCAWLDWASAGSTGKPDSSTPSAPMEVLYSSLPGGSAEPYDLTDIQTHEVGHGRELHAQGSGESSSTDDAGHTQTKSYDNPLRLRVETDPAGNSCTFSYDGDDNVTSRVDLEKSGVGNPDQTYITTYQYDQLDRRTELVDNIGRIWEWGYDSRNNAVLATDARGNRTHYSYDGLNRRVQTARDMTSTGDGSGTLLGTVVWSQTWDDSSRCTSRTDPIGNSTGYVYDGLDRRVATNYADGTVAQSFFDVFFEIPLEIRPNGTSWTSSYDERSRRIQRTHSPGPGVANDTLLETWRYDGLSRLVREQDDDSLVTRSYDSLSNVLVETQQVLPAGPVRTVTGTYDGESNLVRLVYPGGRAIVRTYDVLDRTLLVRDDPPGPGTTVAQYFYVGPKRVERIDFGNGTRFDGSWDGARRLVNQSHTRIAGGVLLDQRVTGYDASDNRTLRDAPLSVPPVQRFYEYDSLDRLVRSRQMPSGIVIDTFLDGAGNRQFTTGPDFGSWFYDSTTPEPADRQMNQVTQTPFDTRQYDKNGNLIDRSGGQQTYQYDSLDRLVRAVDLPGGVTSTYRYDGLGRRIEKVVNGAVTRFYYDAWDELEEGTSGGVTLATHVWGQGIDQLLQSSRAGTKYFMHGDDEKSVVMVTNSSSTVLEHYRYEDYGKPELFDASWNSIPHSSAQNPHFFQGHRFDTETQFSCSRQRYAEPRAGTYVTRDRGEPWANQQNLGNARTMCRTNPQTKVEPKGSMYDCLLSMKSKDHCRNANCSADCEYMIVHHRGLFGRMKPYDMCLCKDLRELDVFTSESDVKEYQRYSLEQDSKDESPWLVDPPDWFNGSCESGSGG